MSVDIHNPANPSEVVGTFPTMSPDDVPAMMATARAAQREWARIPQPERGKIVDAFLDALQARTEDIATAITREMGKVIGESRGEVNKALGEGRATTRRASAPIGEVLPSQKPGTVTYSTRRPRGVIVGINPWNFPFSTPIRKTIPALVMATRLFSNHPSAHRVRPLSCKRSQTRPSPRVCFKSLMGPAILVAR